LPSASERLVHHGAAGRLVRSKQRTKVREWKRHGASASDDLFYFHDAESRRQCAFSLRDKILWGVAESLVQNGGPGSGVKKTKVWVRAR
jgi:hypothetical protein